MESKQPNKNCITIYVSPVERKRLDDQIKTMQFDIKATQLKCFASSSLFAARNHEKDYSNVTNHLKRFKLD